MSKARASIAMPQIADKSANMGSTEGVTDLTARQVRGQRDKSRSLLLRLPGVSDASDRELGGARVDSGARRAALRAAGTKLVAMCRPPLCGPSIGPAACGRARAQSLAQNVCRGGALLGLLGETLEQQRFEVGVHGSREPRRGRLRHRVQMMNAHFEH